MQSAAPGSGTLALQETEKTDTGHYIGGFMEEYAVRIRNLSKNYKVYRKNGQRLRGVLFGSDKGITKEALKDITLDIRKGECIAVVGNVGSGRTTLAKIIAGIVFQSSGSLKVDGKIQSMFDLRAGFDMELTGRENIFVKGGMLGWTGREIKEREADIIEYAEMENVIDHQLRTYTQGLGARLGFSMLVARKPEILVIDNPLVVGNRVFREKMIKTLEAFAHDKDVTIIIVTNDIVLAKRLCTRAVVLEKGKIEFDGSPEAAIMYYRRNFRNDIKESVGNENDSFSQTGDDTDDDYDLEF